MENYFLLLPAKQSVRIYDSACIENRKDCLFPHCGYNDYPLLEKHRLCDNTSRYAGSSILGLSIKALLLTLAVLILTTVVVKPKEVFSFLGLSGNMLKGFGIALLCVLPLYLVFPFFGSLNTELTFTVFYDRCILTGFKEELVFRALMFGLLFRYAKTGFFWAVILPALYFGSVHLYQGHDALSSLAAFGVTFIGALYFSWMYVEWNFNIWIPVGLHILMNGAWHIFIMEGTEVAAGGLISNMARIVSMALAIAITVYYHKRRGEKVLDYPIWKF